MRTCTEGKKEGGVEKKGARREETQVSFNISAAHEDQRGDKGDAGSVGSKQGRGSRMGNHIKGVRPKEGEGKGLAKQGGTPPRQDHRPLVRREIWGRRGN